MKWPPGRMAKAKGTKQLFVGKLEVSTYRDSLGDFIAESYLHMSIYGCTLCIPSKNVGFPLNYHRAEKKIIKNIQFSKSTLIL